jgi:hypothetical protein
LYYKKIKNIILALLNYKMATILYDIPPRQKKKMYIFCTLIKNLYNYFYYYYYVILYHYTILIL